MGGRNGESVFNGDRVTVGEDEKLLEMMLVMAAQQRMYLTSQNDTLFKSG